MFQNSNFLYDKKDVVKVLNNYKDALVDLDALTQNKGNKK